MDNVFHTSKPCFFSLLTLFLLSFSLLPAPIDAKSNAQENSVTIDNGDLLYVIIPKEVTSEFSPTERNYFKEKVEVDRHGYIFLPSQGNIKISGHTTDQISEMLTNNLPKYLSKSDKASVNLIEKRHYIQILGHVNMPGWYNIPESANIQAILSQAGGALEGADLSKVSISRNDEGTPKKIVANIQQYLLKGDTRILPKLHENDTVFVPLMIASKDLSGGESPRNVPKIRIFGAVNQPGIYPVHKDKGINLLDLLITARGETPEADLTTIKIMREDGTKEVFNMQALLTSETPGNTSSFPVIKGGDIIHIARQKAISTDAEGNIVAAEPETITITGPGSSSRGLRPFTSPMTPLEAIAQGGGVSDFADTNDIFIIRRVEGKQQNLPYNYDKALKGEEPDVDFQLEEGDIIFIP
jgi:protein involved in polysaccharide export with SLBB domain